MIECATQQACAGLQTPVEGAVVWGVVVVLATIVLHRVWVLADWPAEEPTEEVQEMSDELADRAALMFLDGLERALEREALRRKQWHNHVAAEGLDAGVVEA